MKRVFFIMAALCATGAGATAIDRASDTVVTLKDTIVVTANRFGLERDKTVWPSLGITKSRIAQSTDISNALSLSAGLDTRSFGSTGSVATASNWGTFNRHMLLLYDGRVVRDYSLGGFNLAEYSPDEFDRIEIVKGPQSAYFGSDAIGGVINLIPRSMLIDRIQASSQIGSFGYGRHHIGASRKLGRFGIGGWGEIMTADNARPNSGARQTMFGSRVDFLSADSRHHLWLSGRYLRDSVGSPGPVPPPDSVPVFGDSQSSSLYEHQKDRNYSVEAHYTRQLRPGTQAQFEMFTERKKLTYYSKWEETWNAPIDTAFGVTTYDKVSSGISGRIQRSTQSLRAAGGIDYLVGSLDYISTEKTPNGETRSSWAGSQRQLDLWADLSPFSRARLQPDISGRLQFVKDRPVQSSYNVGGIAVLSTVWRLKAGYGFAYRLPSLADQFAGDPYTKGNPDLKAETSRSLSLGVTGRSPADRSRVELTFFRQRVASLIQYVYDPASYQYVPQNIDQFHSDGVELNAQTLIGTQFSAEFISVYQHATQTTSTRPGFVDAFYVPNVTAGMTVDYRPVFWATIGGNVRYTSSRWIILWNNEEKTIRKVYEFGLTGLADLSRALRLMVRIDDLTDQKRPSQFGYSRIDGDYPGLGRRVSVKLAVLLK